MICFENFTDHFVLWVLESSVSLSFSQLFILIGTLPNIVAECLFTYRNEASKSKTNRSTRQPAVATEKVTLILLQNFDENTYTELQNTENDSQKIWAKRLKD